MTGVTKVFRGSKFQQCAAMEATPLILGIAGPELSPDEEALFRELRPAGYLLQARNLAAPRQVRALTDALRGLNNRIPLIALSLDEAVAATPPLVPVEPFPAWPAADCHAKTIGMAGRLTGELLRLLGVNLHLGPRLDVTPRPQQPPPRRGGECQAVIDHAGLWNRWLIHRGPLACARTFPGCGGAALAPGGELPESSATIDDLLRSDLLPFTALMPEFHALLTGHVWFPQIDGEWPASLSPRIIQRLMRDQLGFDHHLAITEDLDTAGIVSRWGQPAAARLAISAGNDLAMIGNPTGEIARAAAAAIATAPGPVRQDAAVRCDRVSWRAPAPLPWSERQWIDLCGKATDLRA